MKLQSLLEAIKEAAPKDSIYGIFVNGKDSTARFSDYAQASDLLKQLKKRNPKNDYEVKQADPKRISEGEERSIIQHACTEKLQNYFSGREFEYESKDDLEYDIYQALEKLNVEDCVDPKMKVGGQPIENFASGRVIGVISASDVIYDVMNALDLSQIQQPVEENIPGSKTYEFKWKPDPKKDAEENFNDWYNLKLKNDPNWNYNRITSREIFRHLYKIILPKKVDEISASTKKSYIKKSKKDLSRQRDKYFRPFDDSPEGQVERDKIKRTVKNRKAGLKKAGDDMEEGKSPHKKGSAKYKKHMAAKHASMGEAMEKKMISIQTSVGLMPAYSDHSPLSAKDYHDWTMKTDKNPPKPNIISQRYGIYLDDFKRYASESIQVGDELMIETSDGEGIVVPVLHVIDENILVGWDELAEDIFTEQDRQIAELKKLAGIEENLVPFEKPDDVNKAIKDIEQNGLPMSAKFVNWCKDNKCDFSINFMKEPKEMKKAAIAKIRFEKETGYGTGGEILNQKPPKQQELPFKPRDPEQQELDFDEDLDEAEYRGRKVKLNKPTRGDVKKFKVYVKDPKTGNIKKVNFGHGGSSAKKAGQKTMKIKKSNPKRRKSFRARHNCDNPGPKTKARYWSCRAW